jgi:hypothetical protein
MGGAEQMQLAPGGGLLPQPGQQVFPERQRLIVENVEGGDPCPHGGLSARGQDEQRTKRLPRPPQQQRHQSLVVHVDHQQRAIQIDHEREVTVRPRMDAPHGDTAGYGPILRRHSCPTLRIERCQKNRSCPTRKGRGAGYCRFDLWRP